MQDLYGQRSPQQGGSFRVSGYIALALLALAVLEAIQIRHLYAHRSIEIYMKQMQLPATTIRGSDDAYVTHAWPKEHASCCDAFNTICFIRI